MAKKLFCEKRDGEPFHHLPARPKIFRHFGNGKTRFLMERMVVGAGMVIGVIFPLAAGISFLTRLPI
jgi:hypothetical protein